MPYKPDDVVDRFAKLPLDTLIRNLDELQKAILMQDAKIAELKQDLHQASSPQHENKQSSCKEQAACQERTNRLLTLQWQTRQKIIRQMNDERTSLRQMETVHRNINNLLRQRIDIQDALAKRTSPRIGHTQSPITGVMKHAVDSLKQPMEGLKDLLLVVGGLGIKELFDDLAKAVKGGGQATAKMASLAKIPVAKALTAPTATLAKMGPTMLPGLMGGGPLKGPMPGTSPVSSGGGLGAALLYEREKVARAGGRRVLLRYPEGAEQELSAAAMASPTTAYEKLSEYKPTETETRAKGRKVRGGGAPDPTPELYRKRLTETETKQKAPSKPSMILFGSGGFGLQGIGGTARPAPRTMIPMAPPFGLGGSGGGGGGGGAGPGAGGEEPSRRIQRLHDLMAKLRDMGKKTWATIRDGIKDAFGIGKPFGERIKSIGEDLKKVGNVMTGAFAAGTFQLRNLLKAADPVRFGLMEAQFIILERAIGQHFIPVLITLTDWLEKLSNYFDSFSAEGSKQFRTWTLITLGVLGAAVAFKGLIFAFTTMAPLLRLLAGLLGVAYTGMLKFASATGLASSATGGWVVALAAATVGVFHFSGMLGTLERKLTATTEKMQKMDEVLRHLESGEMPNLQQLSDVFKPEDWEKFSAAGNDLQRRLQVLKEIKKAEEDRLKAMGTEAEIKRKTDIITERGAMRTGFAEEFGVHNGFDPLALFRDTPLEKELIGLMQERGLNVRGQTRLAQHRFGRIRGGLEQEGGMSHEEATRTAANVMAQAYREGQANVYGNPKNIGDVLMTEYKRTIAAIKAAGEAIKSGGRVAERDKFGNPIGGPGPMAFAQRPELMSVADAWRRAQMSIQGPTPEMKLRQDMLDRLSRIADNTEQISEQTRHPLGLR